MAREEGPRKGNRTARNRRHDKTIRRQWSIRINQIIEADRRNLRDSQSHHSQSKHHSHPRCIGIVHSGRKSKRPNACRGNDQGGEHGQEPLLGLGQTVAILLCFDARNHIRHDIGVESSDHGADDTAEVEEAGVVAPFVGWSGENLGADGGDGDETAKETAVVQADEPGAGEEESLPWSEEVLEDELRDRFGLVVGWEAEANRLGISVSGVVVVTGSGRSHGFSGSVFDGVDVGFLLFLLAVGI